MAPRKSTTKTRTPSKRTGTSKAEIGHAQIEFRAYEIFLARGGAHSDDLADWLKAERELNG